LEVTLERPLVELYILARDPVYTSLKPKSKEPVGSAWQNNPKSPVLVLHEHRQFGNNIGLINGTLSGIVDVDLDCEEAVALAPVFLPDALAEFQHDGNARGHMLFRTPNAGKTQQFKCPDTGSTLVELRSTGSQTMLPPSVHPSGHALRFTEISDTADAVDFEELTTCVQRIAACSLVAQNWRQGSRHNLALGLSGLLLKAGIEQEVAESVISVICEVAADTEVGDRLYAVKTTYEKASSAVSGYGLLSDVLGEKVSNRLSEWFGLAADLPSIRTFERQGPLLAQINDENEITEQRVANCFKQWARDKAVYVADRKCWYLWNGSIWAADISGSIKMLFAKFIEEAGDIDAFRNGRRYQEALRKFEGNSKINNAIELSAPQLAISAEAFDTEPMVFAAGNTWLDLSMGKPITPSSSKLLSIKSAVKFDESASCDLFLGFLNQIFQGDQSLIDYVRRAVGYSMTGRIDEQCFFILNGDGANGKSTFLNVVSKLLGGYSRTAASQTLMANQRQGVGDDLIHLVGARMITVSETDRGQPLAEAKLKRMTGGDDITARALYSTYNTFKITGKIFLATNNLPTINGTDNGIYRRFQIVPFDRIFTADEQDRGLQNRLEGELPGILNWALRGCLEWQQTGLEPPIKVLEQLNHYKQDMDTVAKFVEDQLVRSPEARLASGQLYTDYRQWCRNMGMHAYDDRQFKVMMTKIPGVEWIKTRNGKYYTGFVYRQSIIPSGPHDPKVLF